MAKSRKKTTTQQPVDEPSTQSQSNSFEDPVEEKIKTVLQKRQQSMLEEERVLFVWRAPSRLFKKKPKEFFTTIGAIVILVLIILLFVQQFMLMAVVIAFSFVAYMYATVEPESIEHTITTRGFRSADNFYRWDVLGRYWIEEKDGETVLYVETLLNFPRQLIMVIPKDKTDEVFELLQPYVFHEKPEPGFLDKSTDWLKEKFPIEGAS